MIPLRFRISNGGKSPKNFYRILNTAAALTVFHPEYKLVNPLPYHINNALVFPIVKDVVWRRYIEKRIDYRLKDGTFQKIYNQWLLGQGYKEKKSGWNIWDNVIKEKWLSKKTSDK